MGQVLDKVHKCGENVATFLTSTTRRKRRRSMEAGHSDEEEKDLAPKKRKLLTTTQYIYKALYKEERNSDITVKALNRAWKLHKVYLSQSPYFNSMFNGSWKESQMGFVHIEIIDENITMAALDAVFGSFYSDEIEIEQKSVISVLATATLFNIESIVEKCTEVMLECISAETVIDLFEASCNYGCKAVKDAALRWLETNLLCIYSKQPRILRAISVELMTSLVSSHNLYVMQTEFSIYTLLRMWIYLRLHPEFDAECVQPQSLSSQQQQQHEKQKHQQHQQQQQIKAESGSEVNPIGAIIIGSPASTTTTTHTVATTAPGALSNDVIQAFFVNRRPVHRCFLSTPEGQAFVPPFLALRTQYLINHSMDIKVILEDNIIPKEWIYCHVMSHWSAILKVDHAPEEGPQNLPEQVFYDNCMRCGRILSEPGYQKWRWTGFNFGVDLILIADSRVLSIRRHHRNEHERLLSLQTKRQFMIKASVTCVNANRSPAFTQETEISSLNLEKNEEVRLMVMDTRIVHPLLISVYILVTHPNNQTYIKRSFLTSECGGKAVPISEISGNGDGTNERQTTPTNDSAVCVVPRSPNVSLLCEKAAATLNYGYDGTAASIHSRAAAAAAATLAALTTSTQTSSATATLSS